MNLAKATIRTILLAVILVTPIFAEGPPPAPAVFRDAALGFQYMPPSDLFDLTALDRESIQQRAAAMGKSNTLTLLLSLRSGPDDTAPGWHSIGIQTYPREKLGTGSDRDACQTFSRWVAASGTPQGPPSDVHIASSHFLMSTFELREGQLTKRARVYTTIRNGKLLSFAFSANSPEVLTRIAASINTFQSWKK